MSSARHDRLMSEALEAGERRNYQRAAELLTIVVSETDEYPAAFLYLGRSYHAVGNLERAIQFLKYFTELEPYTGAGHFFLGRSYASAGIYSEAVASLKTAAELDPENPQILGMLGYAYLKRRQSEFAVDALAKAVELDPGNPELHTGYLNALVVDAIRRFRRGEIDLARQMFEFLVGRRISESLTRLYLAYCYRNLGRDAEALEQYDWILEQKPDDSILLLHRAESLYRMGNLEHAKSVMSDISTQATAKDEADVPTLQRMLAIEEFEKGRLRRAVEYAKSVIKHVGPDFQMHLLIGEAYRQLESFEKAENHFTRAAHLDRDRIEPRHGLILTYWQCERYEEVHTACNAALRIDGSDDTAIYYEVLSRGKLPYPEKELIRDLKKEIDRSGPDAYLYTSLGEQYLKTGSTEEAVKCFRMAIDLSESHRPAYVHLFSIFESGNDLESASELYHVYFRTFPGDPERRKAYIQILVSRGDYAQAIEQIQLQLPYDGTSESLRRLQAFCLREVGKYREAGIIYRRLLAEHPDSEMYLRSLVFCLDKSDNQERAIQLLERAFAYRSPSITLRLIYGVLLVRGEKIDDALAAFRSALDEVGDDWRVYANIASIYRRKGMIDMYERFNQRAENLRLGSK